MSQHIRKSSRSSSSSDSDLSDGWNIIDNVGDHLEGDAQIPDKFIPDEHVEGDAQTQDKVIPDKQSGDQEVGFIHHDCSSDGESVEVIDHDYPHSEESQDENSSTDLSYDMVKEIEADDIPERNVETFDDIELWTPLIEKFEEKLWSKWFWYIAPAIIFLVMFNLIGLVLQAVYHDSTPVKSLNVEKCFTIDSALELSPNKYIEETNTFDSVTREEAKFNHYDAHDSSQQDIGNTEISKCEEIGNRADKGEITVVVAEEVNEKEILNTENQNMLNKLNTPIETLENDRLSEKINYPKNELNSPDKEIDRNNFKRVQNEDVTTGTRELGKTFKLLTDLTVSQDSKYKLGQSLMILDSLYTGLTDLESFISDNSPLEIKLNKQKFRISQGVVNEINNGITKSIDRLANNIFSKVKKLEKNIQSHWCKMENDLNELKTVQNHLFYDCENKMDNRKKVEKKSIKNVNRRKFGKDNIKKSIKYEQKHFRDFEKPQHEQFINNEKVKDYKNKKNKHSKDKLKNDRSKFPKQFKNKSYNTQKNEHKIIEENVNKENITQKWNDNKKNNVPLKQKYKEQKKMIDIELNSVVKNYIKNVDPNVIVSENDFKQWNFVVKDYKTDNKTIGGEWFLKSGNARSQVRWDHHRSDWMFDRAHARRNKKYLPTSKWFFQRAWMRQQCRQNPSSDWCKSTLMTFQPYTKFR